jgi:hypothetical protein
VYRRIWKRESREIGTDPEILEDLARGDAEADLESFYVRDEHDRLARRLREHLDAGSIREGDYWLLVGTRLYGRSIADYARAAGLPYENLKKRRQRVEAILRRLEKHMRWPGAGPSR